MYDGDDSIEPAHRPSRLPSGSLALALAPNSDRVVPTGTTDTLS